MRLLKNLLVIISLIVLISGVLLASSVFAFEESTFNTSGAVDGWVKHLDDPSTWGDLQGYAGTDAGDSENITYVYLRSSATADRWRQILRGVLVFDTSELPDDCVVVSAVLKVYGNTVSQTGEWGIAVNVFETHPVSVETLQASDYETGVGKFETIPLCDNGIGIDEWNIGDPGVVNELEFNTAGLAVISKTGYTKLGLRESNYDAPDIEPEYKVSKIDFITIWTQEAGVNYRPELVITWYAGGVPDIPTGFEGEKLNIQVVKLTWDSANVSDYYTVRGSYIEMPSDNESGYLIYEGSSTNVTVSGLDLNSTVYYFKLFNTSGNGTESCLNNIEIGGDELELNIAGMTGIISLSAGMILLFINFFFKKGILYLAIIPCMVGCLVEPTFRNAWFQSGCVLVMIFAGLAFFKSMSKGVEG